MEFDFTQKFADINEVPEDFRGLFAQETEGEGDFTLRSGDAGVTSAIAAIGRLNGALKAERAGHARSKVKAVDLSGLATYGTAVEEIVAGIDTHISELNAQVKGGKKASIDIEKIRADLQSGHVKEIEAKDVRSAALLSQLQKVLVHDRVAAQLNDAIDPDLLLPHILNQIACVEEDGVFKALVIDSAKDRRFSGSTGTEMTIKELITEMKTSDKFKPLFKSEAPKGTGQPAAAAARRVTAAQPGGELTPTQKISAGLTARSQGRR